MQCNECAYLTKYMNLLTYLPRVWFAIFACRMWCVLHSADLDSSCWQLCSFSTRS